MSSTYTAGIEFGGTKVVLLILNEKQKIVHQSRIATTTPKQTLAAISAELDRFRPLVAVGVGAFGPIDVNPVSASYGTILSTPKPGWEGTNLYEFFASRYDCSVTIDTDVNAAGLAEYTMGIARGVSNFCYVTIGTGIGGGQLIHGRPIKGLFHAEMGHMQLARAKGDEGFSVACPYHDHCAEGLASGSALSHRWGKPMCDFSYGHDAWNFEVEYLAQFFHNLIMTNAPECIVVGGGVMSEVLLSKVRTELGAKLNGYIDQFNSSKLLDDYLRLPGLGDRAGSLGSLLLVRNEDNRGVGLDQLTLPNAI
ncbi:ROK family protein [Gilvimarinus sp. SDUM040013]|uniref:ROK family protein n=1 Tax=Gilvimarinus gilvus TaxID=3058038 RepID=A0ABU4RY26_9GAMM|nr:ROK family protein [Gilvimarinus sp. SDUM040013]MDO3386185.1 ROK family protein [Gilvimarinus sp. SDUM040013]MDX6849820.1 ROK family protein [Gilvimarinus sp. SDUM040013]